MKLNPWKEKYGFDWRNNLCSKYVYMSRGYLEVRHDAQTGGYFHQASAKYKLLDQNMMFKCD